MTCQFNLTGLDLIVNFSTVDKSQKKGFDIMIRKLLLLAVILVGTIVVGIATNHDLRADDQKPALEEKVTPLLKTELVGMKDKEVNILHIDVPPGFSTVKHLHPGQLFIYVLEGAVTIAVDGKAPIKLGPGDVAEEPSNQWMVGKNLSTTHGAKLVIFEIGSKDKPLKVDAK